MTIGVRLAVANFPFFCLRRYSDKNKKVALCFAQFRLVLVRSVRHDPFFLLQRTREGSSEHAEAREVYRNFPKKLHKHVVKSLSEMLTAG